MAAASLSVLLLAFGCAVSLWGRCSVALTLQCTRSYTSSPLEHRWVTNIGEWQSQDRQWRRACKAWTEDGDKWRLWLNSLKNWSGTEPLPEAVFSYHDTVCTHEKGVTKKRLYIEPLAASLRHPNHVCHGPKVVSRLTFSTVWLAMSYAADIPHRRALFFDLGSTYYDAGFGGQRDSLMWFIGQFIDRGWDFDQIFAWEKKPLKQGRYWDKVPSHMKHRMHFYNVPCNSNTSSDMNPLNMMKRVATQDDYVVFKLDIDHNEIEVDLILQVLATPPEEQLIDEIFWENHVKGSPTQRAGWHDLSGLQGPVSDLNQSYHAFRALRQLGIRAHSWV